MPELILIEHTDGFRSSILMLNGYVDTLAYAARVEQQQQQPPPPPAEGNATAATTTAVQVVQACEFRAGGSTPHAGPLPRPAHWLDRALGGKSPFWRYYGHFAYLAKNIEESESAQTASSPPTYLATHHPPPVQNPPARPPGLLYMYVATVRAQSEQSHLVMRLSLCSAPLHACIARVRVQCL